MLPFVALVALQSRGLTFHTPPLGAQREIVVGLLPHKVEAMPLCSNVLAGVSNIPGAEENLPTNWEVQRLGWMDWYVKNSVFQGAPCIELETNGRLKEDIGTKYTQFVVVTDARRTVWVKEDGTIIAEKVELANDIANRSLEAVYGPESYDLTVFDGFKTTRRTIFPGDGMDALQSQFKPMVLGGKVVCREKKFDVLNPFTGTPEPYVAKVSGWFDQDWMRGHYKGVTVDITCGGVTETAFVTDEGDLMQVALPHKRYLLKEVIPLESERRQMRALVGNHASSGSN